MQSNGLKRGYKKELMIRAVIVLLRRLFNIEVPMFQSQGEAEGAIPSRV